MKEFKESENFEINSNRGSKTLVELNQTCNAPESKIFF
jgi:hypothetical protein